MEHNCPNKGTVDATSAHTRHGANVCSLCLAGDDSGEATLEEVEEKFGGLEEVRGFVKVYHTKVLLYKGIIDKGIIHTKVLLDKGIVRN